MRAPTGLALLAALAGCGEAGPVTAEQVLERSASLTRPEPGLYRTTTSLSDFAMPGVSPQEAERMRLRFGFVEPQVVEGCLDAEDAAQGFLPMVEAMQDGSCTFSRFDADATWLNAEMDCEGVGGTTSQVVLLGEAGTDASRLETQVVQQGGGIPGGEQSFTLVIETERLGECQPEVAPE